MPAPGPRLVGVRVGRKRFADYHGILPPRLERRVRSAAQRLRGRRVLHVNATSRGGGVAELLRSEIPLLRDLGVDAHWAVLKAPRSFYAVTKRIHNGLQGETPPLNARDWAWYESINRRAARGLSAPDWDIIVIHDPQPAALRRFAQAADQTRWIWRCHIDTSHALEAYRLQMLQYIKPFDGAVFTLPEFALDGLPHRRRMIHPGIDPDHDKNAAMSAQEARQVVSRFGIDPDRPLVTQVARFDPWKDPLGVLEAFRFARKRVPNLQLALVGAAAHDDPEATEVLAKVQRAAAGEHDVHLIVDRATDRDVNAFQTHSNVVVQKSIREGFGLTVSEALWSGTPVVGGRAAGIQEQIQHGRNGYLAGSPRAAANGIVRLVRDPKMAAQMGRAGRRVVARRFLLPAMIEKELRLWHQVVDGRRARRPGRRA